MKRAREFHQVQLPAEMSDLHLKKTTIEHEFSSPWEDSDLVLVVEDQKLHVHRSILKMTSPVFKTMLSSDFKEKDANEITLPKKKVNEFVDLLRQIYPHLGNQITLENIKHIYSLADEYQMTKVMNDCRMFLSSVEKTKQNAIDMLLLAQDIGAEEAHQQCCDVTKKMNLTELKRAKGFSDLNEESMKDVLLPLVKRYHECMKEALPQLLGSFDAMLQLWCHKENKYKMHGVPSKCSKHSYGSCSINEIIQCQTCKEMFRQMAQNAQGCYFSSSSSYLKENIASLLEEMMVLTQEH